VVDMQSLVRPASTGLVTLEVAQADSPTITISPS
jgi:hypothetical protein